MIRAVILACFALTLVSADARAVQPDEILKDPGLEARAREISKDIRCLVCQNQSIDDSDAELARDLRVLVRERLTAGDSDEEVVSYLVARYGDFVLLKPPFNARTVALWVGPAVVFVLGVIAVAVFFRRRQPLATAAPAPLSDDEKRRLDALMDKDRDGAP